MEINTSVLTIFVGMLGIILGTLIAPFLNHQLNLKYNRRDLMFKKKLEYFESLTSAIEENIRLYTGCLKEAERAKSEKAIEKIIERLKEGRKKFHVLSSPLYFNIKLLTQKIKIFVRFEQNIFYGLQKLKQEIKVPEYKKRVIQIIKDQITQLEQAGNNAIFEMKKQLDK